MKAWESNPKTLLAVAATLALAGCGGSDDGPPAPVADSVFVNGKVLTVDGASSVAQAFAIKDGKFLAVGSTDAIRRNAGPNTQVVDLKGRTVIPALSDNHFHSAGGGPNIDISKTRSLAELFAKLSEAAAKAAPGSILVSNSDWHEAQLKEQRLPTAAELEAAAPGYATVLVRGGHSYFLSTTSLAKWNITPATAVPAGGAIPKDSAGRLTGELVDTARRLITLPATPAATIEDVAAEQKVLNSYGLVNVRVPGTSVAVYKQYQQLAADKRSSVRYSVLFRGTPQSLAEAGVKQNDGDEWARVWGIKLAVDGGFEGGLMTKPYAEPMGQNGTYYGLQTVTQTAFNEQVIALNRAGWRAATHAVGDAAVDQVLQGYQQANADKDIRQAGWTIEHAFITRSDQYPAMKALNLRMSLQDHLYLVAPVLKNYWGEERASQVSPAKTLLDQGLQVSGGTDASVIPLNPFWVMYHFITRDSITGGVVGVNQAVSRDTALRMLTINYAQLTDETAIKGSIEPNKLGDFVVLSGDFMAMPAAELEDLKAVATFVGGKKVYQDPVLTF